MWIASAISVTDTPAVLVWDSGDGDPTLVRSKQVVVYNDGPGTVYAGGSGVTEASGLPVPPGGCIALTNDHNDKLYAIAGAATTATVRALRQVKP